MMFQAAGPRSKTVILVKNMASKTTVEELKELFSRFGLVARIILPPSGISALVEFQESHEAKAAFTGLAYSKVKLMILHNYDIVCNRRCNSQGTCLTCG